MATSTLLGQSRNELESQRRNILNEISLSSKALKKTQAKKEYALKSYLILQQRVDQRRSLVENTTESIQIIQEQIDSTLKQLEFIQKDLDDLEGEYGTLIRQAYRIKLKNSWPAFLFSAKSFNDAYLRWRYIRQFEKTRNRQIKLLQQKLADSEVYKQELERKKSEKDQLLETVIEENGLLNNDLLEQSLLVKKLTSSEQKQAKALESKRKAQARIQKAIENSIATELKNTGSKARSTTEEASIPAKLTGLSAAFYKEKGKLDWPVQNGKIVQGFGRQNHPELSSIQINNNGIDMETLPGATVKAVFSGEVLSIQYIPGYKFTVILKHGIFYSVYSNLEEVSVNLKDSVKIGQQLGKLGQKGKTFHFEIWHQRKKIDPSKWLK